jgi:hypothetical protein
MKGLVLFCLLLSITALVMNIMGGNYMFVIAMICCITLNIMTLINLNR